MCFRNFPIISDVPFSASFSATLGIVGGGLAGMAAAVAALQRGMRVELFEQRKTLGGRAGSFRDPLIGRWIDHCQHVAMGCCTVLADFCRRTGVDDCFRADRQMHFIAPDGATRNFRPSGRLPAPWRLAPALLQLGFLTLGQRWGIALAMRRLERTSVDECGEETIGSWLRRSGQTEQAIERFWTPVVVGALGDTVDRASLAAARKVFADGFLASRDASTLVLPEQPLAEIFDVRVGAWLARRGVAIHRGTPVRRIDGDAGRAEAIVLADGSRRRFDRVVLAVPWGRVRSLLPEAMLAAMPALRGVERIEPAGITAVHLWFDRPITRLPHAVLVGLVGQWVFQDPAPQPDGGASSLLLHHYQVVISASHALPGCDRNSLLASVLRELQSVWRAAREARLVRWRIVNQRSAVFSMRPGVEQHRPDQRTPIANLALAGDWTSTGWPATMEGAIRSGYLAAAAVDA
jgi:squalene-associated FAD-dependent desaturase